MSRWNEISTLIGIVKLEKVRSSYVDRVHQTERELVESQHFSFVKVKLV